MKRILVCLCFFLIPLFLFSIDAGGGDGKRVFKKKLSGVKVIKIRLTSARTTSPVGTDSVLPAEIQPYVESYTFSNKANRRSKATRNAVLYLTVKVENIAKVKQLLAAYRIRIVGKDEDAYEETKK